MVLLQELCLLCLCKVPLSLRVALPLIEAVCVVICGEGASRGEEAEAGTGLTGTGVTFEVGLGGGCQCCSGCGTSLRRLILFGEGDLGGLMGGFRQVSTC